MTNNNETHLSMAERIIDFNRELTYSGAAADRVCGTEPIHRQRDDGGMGAFLCRLVGNK